MDQSKGFYKFGREVCRPFMKLFYRYKIINKNSIPKEGKFVLVCNHISFSDPVLLGVGQKRTLTFMAKAELFQNNFFGKLINKLGAFPVKRGAGDGKAINVGEELLNKGEIVVIFLEGTRSKTGDFLRPRSGAAMVAYGAGAPVVPACITPVGRNWLFSKRYIHFGEPISLQELGLETGAAKEFRDASRIMMEKIAELREQDINAYKGS